MGANETFIRKELPSLPRLMTQSSSELTKTSDVIVLSGTHPEFKAAIKRLKKCNILVDLVGLNLDMGRIGVHLKRLA